MQLRNVVLVDGARSAFARGARDSAHQANIGASVNQPMAPRGQFFTQGLGHEEVALMDSVAGRAIDADC